MQTKLVRGRWIHATRSNVSAFSALQFTQCESPLHISCFVDISLVICLLLLGFHCTHALTCASRPVYAFHSFFLRAPLSTFDLQSTDP